MTYYTYAIISKSTGKVYIGQTDNLIKRLARHNDLLPHKKSSFTSKNKGPWELIYKESFDNRSAALKREKELKSFQGRKFIKNHINMGR
jgi:putative endonuclease